MNDAIYGCDGCSTTLGRAGCVSHRDRPSPGANLFITHCQHGLDLRLNPRCYLCRPEPEPCRMCGGTATMHVCLDRVESSSVISGGTTR